jgi:hypothetical protein
LNFSTKSSPLIGVNFDGYKISDRQHRHRPNPPDTYISDSFKFFSENGLTCLRVPFYWESYEKDPEGFLKELEMISDEADRNDLAIIYDNHQWECSSFLGRGIGFPDSLLSCLFNRAPPSQESWNCPLKKELEFFWNTWWDRKILDENGVDGWKLQREFVERVIDKVDNKQSTCGFEILNEPQVYRSADLKKASYYHNFMIEGITEHTEKSIYFSYVYSNSFGSLGFPWRQARIKPTVDPINQIVFDIHPYPPYQVVLVYYKLVSFFMKNKTIFAGEYNAGIKKTITINQIQHSQYIKNLFAFGIQGATFWWWSFEPDNDHPAFNMTKVMNNKILPNENFEYFGKSLNSAI